MTFNDYGIDYADYESTERRMIENIHTLMLRTKLSGRGLAEHLNIGRGQIARRLSGEGSFYYNEVRAMSEFFGVTYLELETRVPDYDEWYARVMATAPSHLDGPAPCSSLLPRLDSNQQPSDYTYAQVIDLDAHRIDRAS